MNLLSGNILLILQRSDISYGYQINKVLLTMSYSHQQIYRELGKMCEQGLLTVETEPVDGKPDRTHYEITDEGKRKVTEFLAAELNSDFRKTDGAHKARRMETLSGCDRTREYIEHMKAAEKAFFDQLSNENET